MDVESHSETEYDARTDKHGCMLCSGRHSAMQPTRRSRALSACMARVPLNNSGHVCPLPLCAAVSGAAGGGDLSCESSWQGSALVRRSSQAQSELRLMQALLRRDYAVGYVMLSWLLRCTWVMTPAIGMLLKLPQPMMARAAKHQLPALLAWLLRDAANQGCATPQALNDDKWLEQLSPEKLRQLQDQLLGPTAAVASCAGFAKAYQTLASAPVTAQQVSISGLR